MSPVAFRCLFAQAMDTITFLAFYIFIGAGVHAERNPLVLAIMTLGGIWLLGAFKMADALWVSWRYDHPAKSSKFLLVRKFNNLIHINTWWKPFNTIMLSIAAASGCVGAGFNLASILRSI
jgi:hypothetical protein